MQVSIEETLIAWNTATQEDLKEVVKLWSMIQDLKTHGFGGFRGEVANGEIVFFSAEKKWKTKGESFSECNLTI